MSQTGCYADQPNQRRAPGRRKELAVHTVLLRFGMVSSKFSNADCAELAVKSSKKRDTSRTTQMHLLIVNRFGDRFAIVAGLVI